MALFWLESEAPPRGWAAGLLDRSLRQGHRDWQPPSKAVWFVASSCGPAWRRRVRSSPRVRPPGASRPPTTQKGILTTPVGGAWNGSNARSNKLRGSPAVGRAWSHSWSELELSGVAEGF